MVKYKFQFTDREFEYVDFKKRKFRFFEMYDINDVHLKGNTLEEMRQAFFQMKEIKNYDSYLDRDQNNRLTYIICLLKKINIVTVEHHVD